MNQERCSNFLALLPFISVGLGFAPSVNGQSLARQFSFENYLVAPLRVHLLSAKDVPAVHTTLTEQDITRILGKINGVWAQAGVHFYLESLVSEEAVHPELHAHTNDLNDRLTVLALRPLHSRATNLFHIYYLKEMSANGLCYPNAIFVKDTASLKPVVGGIDEPIPRVSSHELGHALGLVHRQDTTNLMASGTTGTRLNDSEIAQARAVARQLKWIESAPEILKRANALFHAKRKAEAAGLYARLAAIPVRARPVELAKKRVAQASLPNSNASNK